MTRARLTQAELNALVAGYSAAITEAGRGADVQLSGSTLLGSFDGHDIDLVVLVADVPAAAEQLRGLRPPLYEDDWRDDWADYRDSGPPQVDIVVTRPGTKGDAHHRRALELLLGDRDLTGIDWLTAGGESGPKYRPVNVEWLRDLRDRCAEHHVAFFFKQWGGRTPKAHGARLG